MLKKGVLVLAALLLLIQFFRPEKNLSDDQTHAVSLKYPMSDELKGVLEVACNDCHSNKTVYPWYSNFQPVAWWLNHHIEEGKRELNFSSFTNRPIAVQNHKFDEIVEVVEEKEMPLESYTFLGMHKEAKLTDKQRQLIMDWARAQMDTLKSRYPADSLQMKKRG